MRCSIRSIIFSTAIVVMAGPALAQSNGTPKPNGNGQAKPNGNGSASAADPNVDANRSREQLKEAYLKEFAFLKAEKETLQRRLTEVRQEARTKTAAAERTISRLEGRLLALRGQSDSLEERLRDAERESETVDNADVVHETLTRAREPLEAAGFEVPALSTDRVPTAEETVTVLNATFDAVAKLLVSNSRLHSEKGQFFLQDGTLVQGDIKRLGRVAAWGVAANGAGALAPAGGGKLRIWPAEAQTTAKAMVAGEQPAAMRVFLFEQTDKAIVAKEEKTFFKEVEAGGSIAWVIVGIGFVALLMCALRALTIVVVGGQTRALVNKVIPLVQVGNINEARRVVNNAKGAAARVLQATVRNLSTDRSKLDGVIEEAMLAETPAIERFGAAILVVAAVAPLLGLLGTVTGMISTFDVITEFGTGDPRMLSGGISEALITTKLGLIVAIPTLLLGTLLSGQAEAILTNIEHAALRVVNAADGLHSDDGQSAPAVSPRPAMEPT